MSLGNHGVTGGAFPIYLFHPLVPERIHHLLPKIKLITLLRNPTERAISHYFHQKGMGRETLPMGEAFQAEDQRIHSAL